MIHQMYCIHDRATGEHTIPMAFPNEMTAKRYVQIMRTKDEMLKMFPADYNLVFVGQFDTLTGEMLPANKKEVFVDDYTEISNGL